MPSPQKDDLYLRLEDNYRDEYRRLHKQIKKNPTSAVVSEQEEAVSNGAGDFFYHDLPMSVLKI